MEKEPKRGTLPIIGAGVFMVACCAAPLLLGAAGASIFAWFGGFGPFEIGAIALLAALIVYGAIRIRRGGKATADAATAANPSRSIE
jgi:hypothetical protein